MINRQRLIEEFCTQVQIDSESKNEKNMTEYLAGRLTELGLEVRIDSPADQTGSNGGNIYAFMKGTLPGEPLLYSVHMDTVIPGRGIRPIIDGERIRTDGSTILAGDDKSGVAGILEAIRVIKENSIPCHDFEILISVCEEIGLLGAKSFDFSAVKSRKALVLDAAGSVGTIVTNGPGQIKLHAIVRGQKAHAGLAPEKGISAIQAAARGVAAMNLLRIDEETTCNIGTFSCTGPTNIVPDRVEIVGEIRSRNLDKLNAQAEHMRSCLQKACDETGAALECELRTSYVSFQADPTSDVVCQIAAVCRGLGREVKMLNGGGGCDGNVMALHGITPVVLGTGMTDVHTTQESILIKDLEDTSRLILKMMTE